MAAAGSGPLFMSMMVAGVLGVLLQPARRRVVTRPEKSVVRVSFMRALNIFPSEYDAGSAGQVRGLLRADAGREFPGRQMGKPGGGRKSCVG